MNERQIQELVKTLVAFRPTQGGIRIVVPDKPWLFADVRIPSDVRVQVIEWLHNPRLCDKEEWYKIRKPLIEICWTMLDLAFRSGEFPKGLLMAILKERAKQARIAVD